jgi:probable rRNA maturation factor
VISLDVEVEAGAWADVADLEALAANAAAAALAAQGQHATREAVSATLLLTDDAAVAELNRQWRGQDKPTNVLSFPADCPSPPGHPRHLGDIALAYETVLREAEEEGKSLRDHLAHLVVHGVLHLVGHDHATDTQADAMERVEISALGALGIADPYRNHRAS